MAAQVLYHEDFQTYNDPISSTPVSRCTGFSGAGSYPFPDEWLRRNVDGRLPNGQVSYVNDAWIVRDDFQLDTSNCVALRQR